MIQRRLIAVSAAIVLTLGSFAVPAFAEKSPGSGTPSTEHTQPVPPATPPSSEPASGKSTTDTKTHEQKKTEVKKEANQEAQHTQENSLKTEAETELTDLRKNHEKHTDEVRKKNCEAAEKGLETKLQNLSTHATEIQTKIDNALAMAIAYQKDHNLTVPNFDALVSTAKAAGSKAAASVTVLNGLSPNLDCTQNTVATNVASFKVAAKQARTDLSTYKGAVKAVLKALEAVKGSN